MLTSEHILLESDAREVPDPRAARTVHAQLHVDDALRRRSVDLQLVDYYYLAVRERRGRSRVSEFVLDLRFVDPSLRLTRRIPRKCFAAAIVLTALAAASLWHIGTSPGPWYEHGWLRASAVLLGLAVCTTLASLCLTSKTLSLHTVNGRARVLEVTGRLGTFGTMRRFAGRLAAHLRFATAARRPSRAAHLRDEMREHRRLREAGVLAEKDYEAARARILAQHDRPD